MEPRLNVITLAVDDLERALVFYRDGLGLQTNGVVATDLVDAETGAAGAIVIFSLESGLRPCWCLRCGRRFLAFGVQGARAPDGETRP